MKEATSFKKNANLKLKILSEVAGFNKLLEPVFISKPCS